MRDMHATAEILAGKLEKRERKNARKNARKVIVVKKEIAEGEIRTNHGAKEQNDVENGECKESFDEVDSSGAIGSGSKFGCHPGRQPGYAASR